MSKIIDPSTGQATTAEPLKYKIHELELPYLTDNVEEMMAGCLKVTVTQTLQGPQPAIVSGFDTSAAVVFIETARALTAMRERLDTMSETVDALQKENSRLCVKLQGLTGEVP